MVRTLGWKKPMFKTRVLLQSKVSSHHLLQLLNRDMEGAPHGRTLGNNNVTSYSFQLRSALNGASDMNGNRNGNVDLNNHILFKG